MKIGFTGTRKGMTTAQLQAFRNLMRRFSNITEFHHGDCVGADKEASSECKRGRCKPKVANPDPDPRIISHPPTNTQLRAFSECDEERPPHEYLTRNRHIVEECDVLIAVPKEPHEQSRGGTWQTIRLARELGREHYIIWPNGSIGHALAKISV